MKEFITKHRFGLITAFLVGLICVLPQIIFIATLGDNYRGIHILQTPNESGYIAIMQEILDGHTRVASMPFFEYKDGIPLLPPTLAYIYTAPAQIFGVSLINVVIASKFVFPAVLFLSVYLFLYELMKTKNEADNKLRALFAIVAGVLVVFGFDLVDYNSVISYIMGRSSPGGFLIWTRPINPIFGAILLFLFLFSLNRFNFKKKKCWIFCCSISLALMMASYVFSWTLAVVVLGLYSFSSLIKKKWGIFFSYLCILIFAILFSLPYWINVIRVSQMDWYSEAAARIGMFFTHAPHLNKFTVAMALLFLFITFIANYKHILARPFPTWWWLSVVLLLSSLIVYNQQIITGREIWYYHYVFYTIPFAYTVFMLLLWHVVRLIYPKIAVFVATGILCASVSLGIFQQVSAYSNFVSLYAEKQGYRDIFDFFNNQAEKDCVVLIREELNFWDNLIPTFTHCNLYYSSENQSVLADPDDFYHRYLSVLRLKGVRAEDIEKFISENKSQVESALQFQLQRTLGFSDPKLEKRILSMPEDYREFTQEVFFTQLSRFHIDYIMSEGTLDDGVLQLLPNLKEVYTIHGIVIYKFSS